MAEASSLALAIDNNFLVCSICHEPFNDPRALPCLHPFCCGCLENWVKAGSKDKKTVSCPLCKKVYQIPKADGIKGFPAHFLVANLQSTVDEVKQNTNGGFCENHSKTKEYFCENCSCAACSDCGLLDPNHRGHTFIPLKAAAEQQSKSLQDLTRRVRNVEGKYVTAVQQAQQMKLDLERDAERKLQSIDEFLQHVEKSVGTLKQSVYRKKEEDLITIQQTSEKLQIDLARIASLCEQVTNVVETGARSNTATLCPSLTSALQDLAKLQPFTEDGTLGVIRPLHSTIDLSSLTQWLNKKLSTTMVPRETSQTDNPIVSQLPADISLTIPLVPSSITSSAASAGARLSATPLTVTDSLSTPAAVTSEASSVNTPATQVEAERLVCGKLQAATSTPKPQPLQNTWASPASKSMMPKTSSPRTLQYGTMPRVPQEILALSPIAVTPQTLPHVLSSPIGTMPRMSQGMWPSSPRAVMPHASTLPRMSQRSSPSSPRAMVPKTLQHPSPGPRMSQGIPPLSPRTGMPHASTLPRMSQRIQPSSTRAMVPKIWQNTLSSPKAMMPRKREDIPPPSPRLMMTKTLQYKQKPAAVVAEPPATTVTAESLQNEQQPAATETSQNIQPPATTLATEPLQNVQPPATTVATEPLQNVQLAATTVATEPLQNVQPAATTVATEPLQNIQQAATTVETEPLQNVQLVAKTLATEPLQNVQPVATIVATVGAEPLQNVEPAAATTLAAEPLQNVEPLPATTVATEPLQNIKALPTKIETDHLKKPSVSAVKWPMHVIDGKTKPVNLVELGPETFV